MSQVKKITRLIGRKKVAEVAPAILTPVIELATRALEQGRRLGESLHVLLDLRIVAATDLDLEAETKGNAFAKICCSG